ncbi:MAG: hypothetical protein Q8L21_03735 [Candidatus Komeilibacteria bacterium]|nr:hypothetical protein [Candidatus Komeilibacteria bacterium]
MKNLKWFKVGDIAPYCGQEATQAFDTKDIGRPHSTGAAALLGNYHIKTEHCLNHINMIRLN